VKLRWILTAALLPRAMALPAAKAAVPDLTAAVAEAQAGRWVAAADKLSRALEDDPANVQARYYRARCYAHLGREAEAATDYAAVLKAKPGSTETRRELGAVLERLGHRAEAAAAYADWLKAEPGSVEAAAGLARCAPPVAPPAPAAAAPPAPPAPAAEPLGNRVGLVTEGLSDDTVTAMMDRNADVDSGHLLDYTFGSAPVDFVPTAGTWEIVNRFACDPTWSFFGGWSQGLACIWNKREFAGDVVAEAYVSFRHGLRWTPREWGEMPADMCLTLCGDGQNPASGYSFIYSGNEGSQTMIRRGQQTLAATSDSAFLGPSLTDFHPDDNQLHRRWWRLEARAQNGRLQFLVDGVKALEVVDPQPLTHGKVAIWTVHNGMMVARLRVAYDHEIRPVHPLVRVAQLVDGQ
jgi:hypothetical protein